VAPFGKKAKSSKCQMTLEETSDFEVWPKFAATRKSRSRTKGAAKNAKANAKRLEIQGMETCN
jgi:hypothetical protein